MRKVYGGDAKTRETPPPRRDESIPGGLTGRVFRELDFTAIRILAQGTVVGDVAILETSEREGQVGTAQKNSATQDGKRDGDSREDCFQELHLGSLREKEASSLKGQSSLPPILAK